MKNKSVVLNQIEFERKNVRDELRQSIRQNGIAIAVRVVQTETGYRCLDGHQRCTVMEEIDPNSQIAVLVVNDFTKAGCTFWGDRNHH